MKGSGQQPATYTPGSNVMQQNPFLPSNAGGSGSPSLPQQGGQMPPFSGPLWQQIMANAGSVAAPMGAGAGAAGAYIP